MSSSITYHAISNDKYRPGRRDWILRPWSELYDQDPEFSGWLAFSLGVLRPHLILARDKALLSSTAAAATVGSRVRTTDEEKYNTALLELFHPLVPGVDARLMNHIGRAVFSFDRSSKEGLRDIKVVDGPSYGESASVRKQIEWRAAGKVLRAAADDSQQDSQVNEDGGGDAGDGDGDGGRARGSGHNDGDQDQDLRGGEGSSLKVAKTRSRSDAASLSHSRDGSLMDNAGCRRPDLFGLVVSCGPEPKPNPKLTIPGHPRASPILSQRRTDQRRKMSDPPRASDISGQPDKRRYRLSTHSSPLPTPTSTNTPLSLSTRDDGRHHPSVGSRPPDSPNSIARSEEEARGVTRAVWIQGEIKPRREQLIEGLTREMTYLSVAFELCSSWIGVSVVENRWQRLVMLETGLVVVETAREDQWGSLEHWCDDFCQQLQYTDLPHRFMIDDLLPPPTTTEVDSSTLPYDDDFDEGHGDGPDSSPSGQDGDGDNLNQQTIRMFDIDSVGKLWETIRMAASLVSNLDPRQSLTRLRPPGGNTDGINGAWAEVRGMVKSASAASSAVSPVPTSSTRPGPTEHTTTAKPTATAIGAALTTSRSYPRVNLAADYDFLFCISQAGHGDREADLRMARVLVPDRETAFPDGPIKTVSRAQPLARTLPPTAPMYGRGVLPESATGPPSEPEPILSTDIAVFDSVIVPSGSPRSESPVPEDDGAVRDQNDATTNRKGKDTCRPSDLKPFPRREPDDYDNDGDITRPGPGPSHIGPVSGTGIRTHSPNAPTTTTAAGPDSQQSNPTSTRPTSVGVTSTVLGRDTLPVDETSTTSTDTLSSRSIVSPVDPIHRPLLWPSSKRDVMGVVRQGGASSDLDLDSLVGFGQDALSYNRGLTTRYDDDDDDDDEQEEREEREEMVKTEWAFRVLRETGMRMLLVSPALMDSLIREGCGEGRGIGASE